ncbi:malto-oligosyltrehalose trehalohydrolase [Pontibacter sp. SGAir0037]|uniref:malto-oligosyltrehalose trehalohydrolase n=1 Tax=Pontibacter sp. SGAir0037 TaxID=2571030 RepID=UPI0010CD32EA|nr:malto-oligosyltrehalose trehalohydrolase [Pontibacter sp. SGAir0037]QCR23190.1 malto-oligosyltrehalose trehalohydrolase [Pontibacter sp. SGAir0037]
MNAGASYSENGHCTFSVWAPHRESMLLHLVYPQDQKHEMQKDKWGYFSIELEGISPGDRYFFMPDGEHDYPDPASHYQPEGVHGPSQVVDHRSYTWLDTNWRGIPFKDLILYELHIGTFTPEGTFEAAIPYLDDLVQSGINAVEVMPVSEFPGGRNWGYDGVFPYAAQSTYGGPTGFKHFVDACHARGIAVFLDVVYNHLGPEGNYFSQYGPYFTDAYCTPWGDAINYDGAWCDPVREYFSNNPIHWFKNYHIDGLRLDAIHTIYDTGAVSFWELTYNKIKQLEQKLGKSFYMIAESDLNSPRVIKSPEMGGFGFDAQWLDDFHHALYVKLDKEGQHLYEDFGQMEQVGKAYKEGFVHSGDYVRFRKRKHGASSAGVSGNKFIVFNQNHDQVGNRVRGERLTVLVSFERLKLAAAAILLSPYIPMLFMGEEYAEDKPFFYFVSHSDKKLIKAVQQGRQKEFEGFNWEVAPPDPQAEDTFQQSKLDWQKRKEGKHRTMLLWHQQLIKLRRSNPVLQNFNKNGLNVIPLDQKGYVLQRKSFDGQVSLLCIFNLSEDKIPYTFPTWSDNWEKILDSNSAEWLEHSDQKLPTAPGTAPAGKKINLPALSVSVYQGSSS